MNIGTVSSQNLVPNPSFEQVNIPNLQCGYYQSQSDFDNAISNWIDPTEGTSDIWSLSLNGNCTLNPSNSSSNFSHYPRTGNNMVGLVLYVNREYTENVQIRLNSPLKKGSNYRVTFYVLLGRECQIACNNQGAYLSVQPVGISGTEHIPVVPQVVNKEIISDTSNWVKIEANIKATDAWQYITIGNFFGIDSTDFKQIRNNLDSDLQQAYYLIDDVSVVPTCLNVSGDVGICPGNTTTLTASGTSFIGWANSSQPGVLISTDSLFQVGPSTSQTYLAYSYCDTNSVLVKVATDYTSNFLGKDTTLCRSDSITIGEEVPIDFTTYLWDNGSTNPYRTVYSSGVYVLKALVGGCYFHTDTIHVNFAIPNINFPKHLPLCNGQTLTLNAAFPGATYQWNDGYYYYGNTNTTSSYVVRYGGNYSVTITTPTGCTRSFSTDVTFSSTPNTYLTPFQTACPGQSVVLDPTSSYYYNSSSLSYQWQDSSTSQTFTVTSTGTYIVKVFNGCTVYDTTTVFISSDNIFNMGNDTLLCAGQVLLLNAHVIGATTYQWQNGSVFPTYTVTSQGLYSVKVSLSNCSFSESVNVGYVPIPTDKLDNIMGFHPGQTIDLNAGTGFVNCSYQWQNGDTDSTYLVNKEGEYWVRVTNQAGCGITDTVYVYAIDLEMPNTFSPNGDGKNEHFVPIVMKGIPTAHINIQNRWGETVFQSSNLTAGWNGKALGMDVPEGVYFWLVDYTDIVGTSGSQKGTLTLVR